MHLYDIFLSQAQCEALVAEWSILLVGKHLSQIRSLADGISLQFGQTWFWIFLTPTQNLAFLSQERPKTQEPSAFVMLLRKYLKGQKLKALSLPCQDRIADLVWEDFCLRLEILGRHANAFLLDSSDKILGTYRPSTSGRRVLRPGQRYIFPTLPAQSFRKDKLQLQALPPDGSRSKRVEADWFQRNQFNQILVQWQALLRPLQTKQKALNKTALKLAALQAEAEERLKERQWAELLQAAYGHYQTGQSQITVNDYYQAEPTPINLPLNPALTLAENIARYFKRARRAERTLQACETRLLQIWEEEAFMEKALEQIQFLTQAFENAWNAGNFEALQNGLHSLEIHVRGLGLQYDVSRPSGQHPPVSPPLPYRVYQSVMGQEIWVGKHAKANDEMSFKRARGNDLWLHAQNWHGAHVILRLNKGEVFQQESLLDAATLAAWYSQGKNDTRIEIIYTPVKYLRKVKGAAPGEVQISQFKTLTLKLEAKRLERLKIKDSRTPP